jgi:hypothetical protein
MVGEVDEQHCRLRGPDRSREVAPVGRILTEEAATELARGGWAGRQPGPGPGPGGTWLAPSRVRDNPADAAIAFRKENRWSNTLSPLWRCVGSRARTCTHYWRARVGLGVRPVPCGGTDVLATGPLSPRGQRPTARRVVRAVVIGLPIESSHSRRHPTMRARFRLQGGKRAGLWLVLGRCSPGSPSLANRKATDAECQRPKLSGFLGSAGCSGCSARF